MKQKVYIETSVVSYPAARPSRDLLIAARQEATAELWSRLLSSGAFGDRAMKDPIHAEIHKYREEHARKFNFDLAAIRASQSQPLF
jgi:hypothetical protein